MLSSNKNTDRPRNRQVCLTAPFGSIQLGENTIFWKIDYYDLDLHMHSPDPSDPTVTARILTIMLAEEY